jgi:Ca2+-binding EF-hand superfamily protein
MGCCGVKDRFVEEENALEIESEALGFKRLSVSEVDFTIRKYSSESKINRNQLKSLGTALKLNFANYDTHIYIDRLFAKLKTPDQEFCNADPLLVIGLMLAEGDPERKAKALFEIADREEAGVIDASSIHALLNLWVDSTLDLGLLVGDGQNHLSSEAKMRDYIAMCRKAKLSWIALIKTSLGAGMVPKQHFIRVATTVNEAGFLDARVFRMYLASKGSSQPKAFTPRKVLSSRILENIKEAVDLTKPV